MKQVITVLAIFYFFTGVSAQCEKTKMTVDKFKGDTTYSNVANCPIWPNDRVNLGFCKRGNTYYIEMLYSTTGISAMVIGEYDSLEVKLSTGEVMKFKGNKIVSGDFVYNKTTGNYTTITQIYHASKSDFKKLANSNISMLRIQFSDGYHNIEFNERQTARIKEAVMCISEKK